MAHHRALVHFLAFQLENDVQIIRGEDYQYMCYINKEGYIQFDGTPSTNVDCELNEYLEDELLDLTVQNLAMYTENVAAVQNAQFRIQTNE